MLVHHVQTVCYRIFPPISAGVLIAAPGHRRPGGQTSLVAATSQSVHFARSLGTRFQSGQPHLHTCVCPLKWGGGGGGAGAPGVGRPGGWEGFLFHFPFPISPPPPPPPPRCVTVCHHISTGLYQQLFGVLLTVHLSIILVINQLNAKTLIYNKFIICLYMFRALCAHQQKVKIVLLYAVRWTGRQPTECDDTRCCIMQFWPPDDEHIVLETCRGI